MQRPIQLSPRFSLAQLIYSDTARERGIDNSPPPEVTANLRLLAAGLEQVQDLLGAPLAVSSGYRSARLNVAVGGSGASQHLLGLAADFVCPAFGTPFDIARRIRASAIAFDQCILEWGEWVHLSFDRSPRVRVLTIYDAKVGYLEGLWDSTGRHHA